MQTLTTCPICQESTFSEHSKVKDISISQETFKLDTCLSCGFVFTNPQPDSNALSKYYDSEVYISHTGTKKGLINKLYHIVQNFNLKLKFNAIKKHVPRGTWVDYGAGNGAFLSYLIKKKIPNKGFEPDSTARKIGQDKGANIEDTSKYSSDPEKLACITMWHVLEHVPNLSETISEHAHKLIRNGVLTIAVPNHHSFDGKYYKSFWAAYDVPRHLWHFTESDIISLVEKSGLKHIQTKPMPFDAYYIAMLSEKYRGKNSFRGIVIGALSNFYARISGYPFSSQIYIFSKN